MQAIPLPFEIVYTAFIKDPQEVEKFVHKYFKPKKIGKEFFNVEVGAVKEIIENMFDVIDEKKYHLDRMRKGLKMTGVYTSAKQLPSRAKIGR